MNNDWSTVTVSANSPLLQRIGANPGTYKIKWDRQAGVLRVQALNSGQQWQLPLSSTSDAGSLLLGSKTRDDLSQGEVKFLKQLSDATYNKWTPWKQSNYEVRTKTDSTGFVKDILIRRRGTTGDNDHIHIYTDTIIGKQGTHLTVVRNGKKNHHPINGNKSIDDLIDEFTQ